MCRPQTLAWVRRNCYPRFVRKNLYSLLAYFSTLILITSFSRVFLFFKKDIYNYLFRFFSLFGFQWAFLQTFRLPVEMMGFGRSANYALWSPSALTVHRTVIHYLLCSNPNDSSFQGAPLFIPYLMVEMMGFGRSANYALWSPSALTVHRTVIHYLLCSNPNDSSFQGAPLFIPYLMVEMMGFEPMTPCLQGRCSPSWATPP